MRFALAAAALLFSGQAFAAAGTVTFLEGTATRAPKGAEPLPLAPNAAVEAGDLLQTAAGARLEIALGDGSTIRLAESSRVTLDEAALEPSRGWRMSLSLGLGALWAKVAPRDSGAPRFNVRTERVVAGVRGTQFIVDAAEEHSVVVLEGEVGVSGAAGAALGDRSEHAVGAMKAIKVDRDGRTAGVFGIEGRHDFVTLMSWVRKFDMDRGRQPDPQRRNWLERRHDRKRNHRIDRREHRLFGR